MTKRSIFDTHTTREGKEIPIISMEVGHLQATVRLHLCHITRCTEYLKVMATDLSTKPLHGIYLDSMGMDPKALRCEIRNRVDILQPYVFMLMWHGINMSPDLNTALGDSSEYILKEEPRTLSEASAFEDDIDEDYPDIFN